jgi:hypothetical protein
MLTRFNQIKTGTAPALSWHFQTAQRELTVRCDCASLSKVSKVIEELRIETLMLNTLILKVFMQVVICPGVHPLALTNQFVEAVALADAWIYPASVAPAYAGEQILGFLRERATLPTPLLLIGFSAGVVGAAIAADLWQALGGKIVALIAFDGWGMPLRSRFPVHRFSHDSFTHWSSRLLDTELDTGSSARKPGTQSVHFYADPPVGHLNFWRAPQLTQGWKVLTHSGPTCGNSACGNSASRNQYYSRSNAAELVRQIIAEYGQGQII